MIGLTGGVVKAVRRVARLRLAHYQLGRYKNRYNVGYGFINFCTEDACDRLVTSFNGVDVRKCLPGLNSRKVAEMTPTRVQDLEDNVWRLRNSPVTNELVLYPGWMPLLRNEDGEESPA